MFRSRRSIFTISSIAVSAALLVGCAHTGTPPPTQSSSDPIIISIDAPDPATKLTKDTFTVHLIDRADHKPTPSATVTINLVMSSMAMPESVVKCNEVSPGIYSGTGTFSMPGDWRLDVKAMRGQTSTASFPVHVE